MADSRCAESTYERRQLVLARRREIVRLAGAALPALVRRHEFEAWEDIGEWAVQIAVATQRKIDELEGKDGF